MLYNRAWALLKRDQDGDRMEALRFAEQSRNFFHIMGDVASVKFVEAFIDKNNLDCGCGYDMPIKALACIRLENMVEYYC